MKHIKYLFIFFVVVVTLLGYFWISSSPKLLVREATVLKEIKNLASLETASFTFEKIIENSSNQGFLKGVFFGDKILLVAQAEVVAGFNLYNLDSSSVVVRNGVLIINLDAPEILSVKLNNEQTKVYDRTTGIFTRGDKNLESEARALAEKAILKDACNSNILAVAKENGEKIIKAIFSIHNFKDVIVNIENANCE